MKQPAVVQVVRFDSAAFTLETVKRAAYRFLDRFTPTFEVEGTAIVCHLRFPTDINPAALADIVDDFNKEVLDQDLRQLVATETGPYRNAILALAFSSSKLTKDE